MNEGGQHVQPLMCVQIAKPVAEATKATVEEISSLNVHVHYMLCLCSVQNLQQGSKSCEERERDGMWSSLVAKSAAGVTKAAGVGKALLCCWGEATLRCEDAAIPAAAGFAVWTHDRC